MGSGSIDDGVEGKDGIKLEQLTLVAKRLIRTHKLYLVDCELLSVSLIVSLTFRACTEISFILGCMTRPKRPGEVARNAKMS